MWLQIISIMITYLYPCLVAKSEYYFVSIAAMTMTILSLWLLIKEIPGMWSIYVNKSSVTLLTTIIQPTTSNSDHKYVTRHWTTLRCENVINSCRFTYITAIIVMLLLLCSIFRNSTCQFTSLSVPTSDSWQRTPLEGRSCPSPPLPACSCPWRTGGHSSSRW